MGKKLPAAYLIEHFDSNILGHHPYLENELDVMYVSKPHLRNGASLTYIYTCVASSGIVQLQDEWSLDRPEQPRCSIQGLLSMYLLGAVLHSIKERNTCLG